MIKNILIGLAVVLSIVGTGFGVVNATQIQPLVASAESAVVKLGSTIEINPYWYSGGLAIGTVDNLNNTAKVVLQAGQNQATWFPPNGGDTVIDSIDLSMTGTASGTSQVNIGTTTSAAAIVDVFSLVTKPFWSQAIDSFQIATGSAEQTGAAFDFLTTNFDSHKTSYPSKLQIPAGDGIRLMDSTFCLTDGACNTATSSARGWTTMTATINYHYKGPD